MVLYELFHDPQTEDRPALYDPLVTAATFREIFTSWKQAKSEATPQKIVYLLQEQCYDEENPKRSQLDNDDDALVAVLEPVAAECGIHLALATVCRELSGKARHRVRRDSFGELKEDDIYDVEPTELKFFDKPVAKTRLTRLVAMDDGHLLQDSLTFDSRKEFIPTRFEKDIVACNTGFPGSEYEGYDFDEEVSSGCHHPFLRCSIDLLSTFYSFRCADGREADPE